MLRVRGLAWAALVALPVGLCGCGLRWQVVGPAGGPCYVGPLQIDAQAVDTTELKRGHPFKWRGMKRAAFMVFDVTITNTGPRDVLCQVGHLDFPGMVVPQVVGAQFVEGALLAPHVSAEPRLLGTDDLQLASLTHERASVLMEDGQRYPILEYRDFCERYSYLMLREMQTASALAFIPYGVGAVASAIARGAAARNMPERLMEAQQMVMRPGVVPAGQTVHGLLVFGWPPEVQPGRLTLRLPVQPGWAASIPFALVRR